MRLSEQVIKFYKEAIMTEQNPLGLKKYITLSFRRQCERGGVLTSQIVTSNFES